MARLFGPGVSAMGRRTCRPLFPIAALPSASTTRKDMELVVRILLLAVVLAVTVSNLPAIAAEPGTSAIGEELQVFPGDKFYVEGDREDVPVLELASIFEGRMPGVMHIPFSFAIDSRRLRFSKRQGSWDYFAAPEGKGRAWHGLIGDVMAPGDTVGVRINRRDGSREWFVDNSRHNGMSTIWRREISSEDVAVRDAGTQKIMLDGARLRGLEYLGVRDNQLRVRYEEFGPQERREEFLFPITHEVPLLIGVMGLRAEVRDITGASARIKILHGFAADGFADPVN